MSRALDLTFIASIIQTGTSIFFFYLIMLIFTCVRQNITSHTPRILTGDECRGKTEESGGGELKVSSKDEVAPASWRRCQLGAWRKALGGTVLFHVSPTCPISPNQTSVSLRKPSVNFPLLANGVNFSGQQEGVMHRIYENIS